MRLIAFISLMLFSTLLNAAPMIIDSSDPECLFHTSEDQITTLLDCRVAVQQNDPSTRNPEGSISAQGFFYGEYKPKPAYRRALTKGNIGEDCLVVYNDQLYRGSNYFNIVQPQKHTDFTMFYLSCAYAVRYFED